MADSSTAPEESSRDTDSVSKAKSRPPRRRRAKLDSGQPPKDPHTEVPDKPEAKKEKLASVKKPASTPKLTKTSTTKSELVEETATVIGKDGDELPKKSKAPLKQKKEKIPATTQLTQQKATKNEILYVGKPPSPSKSSKKENDKETEKKTEKEATAAVSSTSLSEPVKPNSHSHKKRHHRWPKRNGSSTDAASSSENTTKVKVKKGGSLEEVEKAERSRARLCSADSPVSRASLSAEGLALLEGIKEKSRRQSFSGNEKIRVGKISMNELMGSAGRTASKSHSGLSIVQRLIGNNIDPEAVFDASIRSMPPIPGFPSLTHRPDNGPFSTPFRPELFKTSMEAYTLAAQQSGLWNMDAGWRAMSRMSDRSGGSRSPLGGRPVSPDMLPPWINLAPMFPTSMDSRSAYRNTSSVLQPGVGVSKGPNHGHPHPPSSGAQQHGTPLGAIGSNRRIGGYQGNHGGQQQPQGQYRQQLGGQQNGQTRGGFNHSMGPNQQNPYNNHNATPTNPNNQKTRKPYFMPYLNIDVVNRGLQNNDLIKGSLRVNQRNYEESYVDNPEGDDQLDLLILGVHDRNRALHGDVVVVKTKERMHWVVRENLYKAWREGHLNIACEDDGKPLTIPPLPVVGDTVEVMIGGLTDLKISKADLEKKIPKMEDEKYDRETMVTIGAQLEVARRRRVEGERMPEDSLDLPSSSVMAMIEDLSITRLPDQPSTSGPSPVRKSPPQTRRTQFTPAKRTSHRTLADMPDEDWGVPDVCLQKTAEVVFISEAKNCRAAMGQLKVMTDGNRNFALFSPTDSRMPRMMIPADQLPANFFERPQDFAKFIFVARMVDWQATAQFARGKLERTLGLAGDVEAETEGLLFQHNVDTREFSAAALGSLPITESKQWSIDEKEFKYRRDLRDEIIFTIDPKTARDLDDALSIKPITDCDGNGTPGWEIGVHIADVTHFVYENTELDAWAASRATSVYLVHKVIPMLPRLLCEELCSLNSGVDRLTFSVIWKMNDKAEILDEWFGRSIIRSKVKLAYEHAQDFIEQPDREFAMEEIPEIFDNVSIGEIKQKVLYLHEIAKKLRTRRVDGGALRLDQPKLKFALDDETKMPNGVSVYQVKDSNKLVEEFMLLANMAVARKIESHYPKVSLLRRHPPPKQKVMREVLELCEKIGFPLDAASSGRLSNSLMRFAGDDQLQRSINQVLSMMMMKPMQLALYFCSGTAKSVSEYHHYALNAPYYTHFTSPIRRYPDIMVHRLLAAALGYAPVPGRSIQEVEAQAVHCNDKKAAAKNVSDASDDVFFGLFIKQCGPVEARGVVVNVLDASFDVLIFQYGVVKRVYVNRLNMARDPVFHEGPPPSLTLYWTPPQEAQKNNAAVEQLIQMCTVVDVVLTALPEPTKYQAVIKIKSTSQTHTLLELDKSGASLE